MTGRLQQARRWIGLIVVALLVATGCLFLATWQWHRREARLAANHLIETNYDREPVALNEILATNSTPLPRADTWTPTEVRGEYVPASTTLVRNRPRSGEAGFSVLVPLRMVDGRVLIVNRGFVPTGQTGERPDAVPAPPSEPVTVVARLQPPETPRDQQAPTGQTYRITPAALAAQLASRSGGAFTQDQIITGGYGLLAAEVPAASQPPQLLPEPPLDEGPHLSYSIQWVIFAIGAVTGVVIVIRRTLEDERAERALDSGDADGRGPRRRPIRERGRDEEEEDALLDAALRSDHEA